MAIVALRQSGHHPTFGHPLPIRWGEGRGEGQARYLCYYLQEQGLLAKFYREFVANVKGDPTGFKALQRVLGEEDMMAFQKKWEKFILELRTTGD